MNRGFIIVAQNSGDVNYIACATELAKSIKRFMPNESVALLTDATVKISVFDHIILFPHGDMCKNESWKLSNDWQVYDASPYKYTIKLEADMYIPKSIEYWWDVLKHRDINISTTIRNYRNEVSNNRYYRRIFDDNDLPDVYNAITYFKKSKLAKKFYELVKDIFSNWQEWKELLPFSYDDRPTTDVVYAIAARTIGIEQCILQSFSAFSMIHMKQAINSTKSYDWQKELVYEIHSDVMRINTFPQEYPLHYHIKTYAQRIQESITD